MFLKLFENLFHFSFFILMKWFIIAKDFIEDLHIDLEDIEDIEFNLISVDFTHFNLFIFLIK